MYKKLIVPIFAFSIMMSSCSNGQEKMQLSVTEFASKIKELPTATILDVRTPEEFEKGHLEGAKNIDWRGNSFDNQIAELDKSKPLLVYCLSGGRSSSAASKLREQGFKEVYEMNGGMMQWRSNNLPETTDSKASSEEGMTQEQFDALLNSDKLVLIDFYAPWCAPCKKIKPFLDEIGAARKEDVTIIRVDVDANPALAKAMNIESIPLLKLYKNKKVIWENVGYISKEDIEKQLK